MKFDYFYTRTINAEIDISDTGNCAIEANNDLGFTWYMVTKTELGITELFQYGPIVPDIKEFPKSVSCFYSRFDYNEKKICNEISKFLNDGYKAITQAQELDQNDALNSCASIIEYMKSRVETKNE